MSNATTLQTNNNKLSANNTDLASILNTINNLPEAGSGGGSATPDTCTISIDYSQCDVANVRQYAFATFENNKITTKSFVTDGLEDVTYKTMVVNNVVCSSDFKVSYGGWLSFAQNEVISNNIGNFATDTSHYYFSGTAPTTAGATGTIVLKKASGEGPPEM